MSPGPRVPDSHELRSLRPTPVARSSEGHPMTDTPSDGRPTAARTHRTATVILCIRIGPIESAFVGHVTAGSAAVETDCMPTPLQRDAGELPPIARYNGPASHTLVNACAHETSFWTPMCVSHVTLASTCLFIPNGPLMLQKTPHTMTYDALPEHYTWTQGLVCM